tara:strand:+ start:316 stop:813 length:498 start_codon:yes stop_codon:yes gene_type:complete
VNFGGLSGGYSGAPRIARPRSTLKPHRNPDLEHELNNSRIYAVLLYLWKKDIAINGPTTESLVATATLATQNRFIEVYHIFPTTKRSLENMLVEVFKVVGDVFEFDGSRLVMSPGLLVTLEPKTGDMIWAGVASKLNPRLLESYVRGPLASHLNDRVLSFGWNGY